MGISLGRLCLLLTFFMIIQAHENIHDIMAVFETVQKLYWCPTIFIVYNKPKFGFEREKDLLKMIKIHSSRGIMSQTITYDDLNRTSVHRGNALHSLIIYDEKDLDYAINVTKDNNMSTHPWLLYMSRTLEFDCDRPGRDFFKMRMDTRMMAMCDRNKVLYMYYGIVDDQTEVVRLAEWTSEKVFNFTTEKKVIEVGTDMKGITLKLAKRNDYNDEVNKNLSKFVSKLIDELKSLGRFETEVSIQDDRMGHYDRESNKWSGLMETVHEGQADIGVVLFSMSNSRMDAVDFATPLAMARFYLYAKLPDNTKIYWSTYFRTFSKCIWLSIGISILLFSMLLCAMNDCLLSPSTHSFFKNLINVWAIFSQQGVSEIPSNSSTQILYFSILFLSLIIQAIYSASITSYITGLTANLPFSTYEEFLHDGSYKVTVLKDSRDEDLIMGDDKKLMLLKSHLIDHCELARNPYEGFQQACHLKTAFYSDEVSFDGITYSPPCNLGLVDMKRVEHMSFILTKDSPYTKTISFFIFRLREHGILRRLKNKYFYKYTEIPDMQPNVISIEEAFPIFAIWIIGASVAAIVGLLEVVWYKYSHMSRHK